MLLKGPQNIAIYVCVCVLVCAFFSSFILHGILRVCFFISSFYHTSFHLCLPCYRHFYPLSFRVFVRLLFVISIICHFDSVCVPSIRHFYVYFPHFYHLSFREYLLLFILSLVISSVYLCVCLFFVIFIIRHLECALFLHVIIRHFEYLRIFSFRHFYQSLFPLGVSLLFFILSVVISSVL